MEEPRIYERNPDTGVIRSWPFGNHDPKAVRIEKESEFAEKRRLEKIISRCLADDRSIEELNKIIHFLNGGDAIH